MDAGDILADDFIAVANIRPEAHDGILAYESETVPVAEGGSVFFRAQPYFL